MIIQKTTPNYLKGRNGYKPEAIVIHIMAGTLVGTDAFFSQASSQVSSHYGIGVGGEVHQYVQEEDTAFHAGQIVPPTSWKLLKAPPANPNSYTIGIEHEGQQDSVWTDIQKKTSATLIKDICVRWNIPIDRDHIIGHYQIKSSKPNCPAVNKGIIDELISLANGTPSSNTELKKQIIDLVNKIQ